MNYIFAKLIDNEDTLDFIEIMSGFDCMCKLLTKVEMLGCNLSDGEYVIVCLDDEYEVEIENVVIVEDGCIEVVDPEDYFD